MKSKIPLYSTILAVPLAIACATQPVNMPKPKVPVEDLVQSAYAEQEPQYEATATPGIGSDPYTGEDMNADKDCCEDYEMDPEEEAIIMKGFEQLCKEYGTTDNFLSQMINHYHMRIDLGTAPAEAAQQVRDQTWEIFPSLKEMCGGDPGLIYKVNSALMLFNAYLQQQN